MCDYTTYEKSLRKSFTMINPTTKSKHKNKIRFHIVLFKRTLDIFVYKDMSLEDLYIKIYNAVYPEFSTEKKYDSTLQTNAVTDLKKIPKIHFISVINANEQIVSVPFHRFIEIDTFMKTKQEYFKNISLFGIPTFKIYVIDEDFLEKSKNSSLRKTPINYLQKYLQCYTSTKNK